MLKATKIKETGKYLIKFPRGEYQVISGGERNNFSAASTRQIELNDISDIKEIHTTDIISEYQNSEGETLSAKKYEEQLSFLASKGIEDEYSVEFKNLDEEYAYKKFRQAWTPVFRKVISFSDILPVEVTNVTLDSGNEFINSLFSIDGDPTIYIYDRNSAVFKIVHDVMKDLDMKFKGNLNYTQTKNEKVWGNSEYGGIRFVTAFGGYVFNGDEWNNIKKVRGTLENMLLHYENDVKNVNEILRSKYKLCFDHLDKNDLNFLATNIQDLVEKIGRSLQKVDAKQKSASDLLQAKNHVSKLIEKINKILSK